MNEPPKRCPICFNWRIVNLGEGWYRCNKCKKDFRR
jgi:ribosomal protein L37AE/L43A